MGVTPAKSNLDSMIILMGESPLPGSLSSWSGENAGGFGKRGGGSICVGESGAGL